MNKLIGLVGDDQVLWCVVFDFKFKFYNFFNIFLVLVVLIIGLLIVLIWVLGFGFYWMNCQFKVFYCEFFLCKFFVWWGVFFCVEKMILLEQIQDLMVKEGFFFKVFGFCVFKIEIVGQSFIGGFEVDFVGIVELCVFCDEVLVQCDVLCVQKSVFVIGVGEGQMFDEICDLLCEICDQLGMVFCQCDDG